MIWIDLGAYLLVGFAVMSIVWYFAPWDSDVMWDTPAGVCAIPAWPLTLLICIAIHARRKGIERRVRIAVERTRREKETQEIDRIIAEQKL